MQPAATATLTNGSESSLTNREMQPQQSTLETKPVNPVHNPRGGIPNTPLAASTISFLLGCCFSLNLYIFLIGGLDYWWSTPQLAFYLAAWSAFHWGEFTVTAGWNREKCTVSSFLLDNGVQYHYAHSVAILEYLVTLWFAPSFKTLPYLTPIGISLVIVGQILRSGAMIHAGTSFSHTVAHRKLPNHVLVTDGIYAWFRHPSYTGFFYWALGTQIVLQNPVTFVVFFVVLYRFFSGRIKYEESRLIAFFGQSYVDYKSRVGTKIPFIP